MSVEIIEQLLTEVVSQLKHYDLLVDNMSVGEVVDLLLDDECLNLKEVY